MVRGNCRACIEFSDDNQYVFPITEKIPLLFNSTSVSFCMKTFRFFSLLGVVAAFCGMAHPTFAQKSGSSPAAKPRISLGIERPGEALPFLEKGFAQQTADSFPALLLRERSISLFRRDTAFQLGSVAINRIGGAPETLLVVAYAMEYFDANGRPLPNVSATTVQLPAPLPTGAIVTPPYPAPLPVAINGLQGDLTPTSADPNGTLLPISMATRSLPNTANIQPSENRVLLNFTARWSDQTLEPRNAGLQGRRFVRLTLLRVNDVNYELGVTLATVTLEDPLRVGPVIMNAIQNKQLLRGTADLVELETPGFRSDGRPNSVFYDENYNVLTYRITSSDSTIVSAQVRQSDARFNGRPSLFYAVQPGAPTGSVVTLSLTADDGTGLLAQDMFTVQVVNNITSVAAQDDAPLAVTPNPTSDRVSIAAKARNTGRVTMRLMNALGVEMMNSEQRINAGAEYRQEFDVASLPHGVYFVEIQDGATRNVRKVVKN